MERSMPARALSARQDLWCIAHEDLPSLVAGAAFGIV
jgi:hypothetical protein